MANGLKVEQVVLDGDGTDPLHAVSVQQLDAAVEGVKTKRNVDAATTAALPANSRTGDVITADVNGAFPTVDGIAAALNNEYLVKNEVTAVNNGVYILTVLGDAGTKFELTRRDDFDDATPVAGARMHVEDGTANGEVIFQCTNDTGTDVVNTDALVFGTLGAATDHGTLLGLGDDDHTQYHNDTRGDIRYHTKSEFINATTGVGDAAKPIETDAAGVIDASFLTNATSAINAKSGRELAASFAGPGVFEATITLPGTAYADALYSVRVTPVVSTKNDGFNLRVFNQTTTSFDVSLGAGNASGLVAVAWETSEVGAEA